MRGGVAFCFVRYNHAALDDSRRIAMKIVRCVACDGYGWIDDEDEGETECRWCVGIGYMQRDAHNIDRAIPSDQLPALEQELERLEVARLRELGYSGSAKKPWEQKIRQAHGNLLNGE
jgi:hypothetical protein